MVATQIFFIFTSNLGEMIQFDEHIFQRGWFNHQLGDNITISHPSEPNILYIQKNPSPGRCGCGFQLENLPGDAKLTFQNCSAKSGGAVRVIGEGWSQCL